MRRRRPKVDADPPGAEASLEIAAHFLGTRPRTRWEVERRLQRARAADDVIQGTLERLTRLGLVDDLAFARWWMEQRDRHAPRGRRLVEAELRQHGVARDVVEQLGDELVALETRAQESASPDLRGTEATGDPDTDMPTSEAGRAQVALARHLRGRPMPEDRPAIQRLGAFLVRRGFDPDTVRSTLRAAGSAGSETEE